PGSSKNPLKSRFKKLLKPYIRRIRIDSQFIRTPVYLFKAIQVQYGIKTVITATVHRSRTMMWWNARFGSIAADDVYLFILVIYGDAMRLIKPSGYLFCL